MRSDILMDSSSAITSSRPASRAPGSPTTKSPLPRSPSAALRGASKAFGTSPNPPGATSDAHKGQNGALAAAAAVGLGRQPKTTLQRPRGEWNAHLRPRSAQRNRRRSLVQNRVKQFEAVDVDGLQNDFSDDSAERTRSPSKSPSHVAAKLAASRSTPASPASKAAIPLNPSHTGNTDVESINWLPPSRREPVIQSMRSPRSRSPMAAPKPIRIQSSNISPLEAAVAVVHTQDEPQHVSEGSHATLDGSSREPTAIAAARLVNPAKPPHPSLPPRHSSAQAIVSRRSLPPDSCPQPLSIQKTRRANEISPVSSTQSNSSPQTWHSTSSHIQRPRISSVTSLPVTATEETHTKSSPTIAPRPPVKERSASTLPEKPHPQRPAQLRQSTPQPPASSVLPSHTVDSLASAIVASSLATSRASSPGRSNRPGIPPPPSKGRHAVAVPLLPNHSGSTGQSRSRPPSPPKQHHTMRTTMRTRSHSSETPKERDKRYHKHNHIIRKAPNKHHEGSRARWRHEVPEAARKRYEGVWAANKGLLLPSPVPSSETQQHNSTTFFQSSSTSSNPDVVVNIVVRDIWSRSRLPNDTLEEVWDLVDRKREGVLYRDEFVVGMWLIDQRLKGRKLPGKVGESVWNSVRYLKDTKIWRYKP